MRINLKKIFIVVVAGIFVLGLVGCGFFDKVAVIVDGEKITQEQVDKAIKPLTMGRGEMTIEPVRSPSSEFGTDQRMRVLNSLIEDIIYRREAERMGIKVSDKEVEVEVNKVKKQFRSEADFRKFFADFDWTLDDFRDYIKIRLIRSAVDDRIVKKVKVTEKEVRDYYENNKEQFKARPEQAEIGFIQLRTEQEAQDVLAKIRGGMDFDEAMLRFSIDPGVKTEGIQSGFVQRGDLTRLSPQVEEAAFTLAPGEVTEPVQTQAGWLLMKVYEKKAATQGTYEEVKSDIERRLKISKWMDEALMKTRMKILI